MNNLKYVVIDNGTPIPYIFPDIITHSDFTKQIKGHVVSAGFCVALAHPDGHHVIWEAFGKSHSLNISSNPEADSRLINKLYCGYPID